MTASRTPRIEIVPAERLAGLRDEWFELWRRCASATPFQAPGWLLPWARHYAPGRCGAAALRSQGRLAALLPFFTWEGALYLAGTGPSDYGDGLFPTGCRETAARLVAAVADGARGEFERIELRQVPASSPLLGVPAPGGWTDARAEGEVCPVLRLRGADGMDAVSRRWRANWRYALRRIEREGGVLDLVPAAESAEAVAALERLHGQRWRARGEGGVFQADPLLPKLLRDAVPELAASDLVRVHRLRFGAETAAILLVLCGHEAVFYFLGGFDPAFSRFSPGAALVGAAIAEAAREGAGEFHFLRGREAYKYRWGAEDRPTARRVLTRTRAMPHRGPTRRDPPGEAVPRDRASAGRD